jgi:hypothetical protein
MAKSSIELTLKQLIDLGIIKLKKKRRRRKQKRVKQYIPDNIKSDSSGMVGYSQTTAPNYLNQNTDALRLRDAQADINTRQLEQRLQLEDAKQNLDDVKQNSNEFELKSKQAFLYVLNSINNPLGYAEDDNIGVFGATQGSDGFISQRDTQPSYPAIKMAEYSPSDIDETIPATDNISVERQDRISSSQTQIPPAQESLKSPSILKGIKGAIFGSGSKKEETQKIARKTSFQMLPQDEDFDTGEPDVIGMNETAPLPDPVLVNRQGIPIPQVFIKAPKTPQKEPQQKEIQLGSGDYPHVNKTAVKPTKEEVLAFRNWYQDLAGDDVSFEILTSGKRSVLEPAIIKILLDEYKSIGGDNKKLLKSKDSKEVARELERLRRLNKILT